MVTKNEALNNVLKGQHLYSELNKTGRYNVDNVTVPEDGVSTGSISDEQTITFSGQNLGTGEDRSLNFDSGLNTAQAGTATKYDTGPLNDEDSPGKSQSMWQLAETSESAKKGKSKKKTTIQAMHKGILDLITLSDNTTGPSRNNPKTSSQRNAKIETLSEPGSPNTKSNSAQGTTYGAKEESSEVWTKKLGNPKLPQGKKMLDIIVQKDVDSLYKTIFDNDTFFEIVIKKTYNEVKGYNVTPWLNEPGQAPEREIQYEFMKIIAFSRNIIKVKQFQTLSYAIPGKLYAIDSMTTNMGVMYANYFLIYIHFRITKEDTRPSSCNTTTSSPIEPCAERSRFQVIADIEFLKPCLFQARIESETWSGMKTYYEFVENEIRQELTPPSHVKEHEISKSDSVDHQETHSNIRLASPSSSGNQTELRARNRLSQATLLTIFTLMLIVLIVITLVIFKLTAVISSLMERIILVEEKLKKYETFIGIDDSHIHLEL